MAIMLWVAGAGAFIAKMPELGIAVWMVNIINGSFSFFQEFQAEKATEALKKILPASSRVMRDGEEHKVLAEEIVPGDVIFVQEGDSIPVDCRLLYSTDLRVNQSTLTGESRAVNRSAEPVSGQGLTETETPNLIFAGTFVAAGSGKAIVYGTGMNTAFGKIAKLTQDVPDELSPLQLEMQNMTKIVTLIALGFGLVFLIMALFLARITFVESIIFALGMVVAFVPEGLLPTVTLSLAMATQRMAKRHALIKKLSAVETLGCTNVICTDKTGTLTQNEMTVRRLGASGSRGGMTGREIDVAGIGYEPKESTENGKRLTPPGLALPSDPHPGQVQHIRLLAPETAGSESNRRWRVLGDPTEGALIVLAHKAGYTRDELAATQLITECFRFAPQGMSVIHLERGTAGFERVAYVKGGIREILDVCDSILVAGQVQTLTPQWAEHIMAVNDAYAREGLRVLAAATRTLPLETEELTIDVVEQKLTYLGMVAMQDPPGRM